MEEFHTKVESISPPPSRGLPSQFNGHGSSAAAASSSSLKQQNADPQLPAPDREWKQCSGKDRLLQIKIKEKAVTDRWLHSSRTLK